MVAVLSAFPYEAIFNYADVVLHRPIDVNVNWDTGDPAVKGRVFRSVDGTTEKALTGAALRQGNTTDKISLNEVLTLVLRNEANHQELARTSVTTGKDALATYMTDPNLLFIYALQVNPGVETIGISFQTKQPAVPYIEIRRHDSGELVDSWMGGSFRQQHAREFDGWGRGLPQETMFDVRIAALKDIGGGRVRMGSGAHNPEVRGAVTTGSRTVSFLFDLIYVRRDGDPNSPGEFTFTFGVGDVATRQQLGPTKAWGEGSIADGGQRDISKTITVHHAPRWMWAQVNAFEDDSDPIQDALLGHEPLMEAPVYAPPGSNGHEYSIGAFANVTEHFDTDQTASGRLRPFTLSTGEFAIAYEVSGSMRVIRQNGTNHFRGMALGRVKTPPGFRERARSHSVTLAGGQMRAVRLAQGLATVNLSPEGRVIVRTVDPRTGAGSVVDLGGCFDESVTLVASPRDTLHVFGLAPSGEVIARTLTPGSTTEGDWIQLGGTFTGRVTCVAREGLVHLLVRDGEGQVWHRTYPACGDDEHWTRIGGGAAGAIAATGTPAGDLAVLALDREGRILHKRLTAEGEWTPPLDDWDVVCRVDERSAAEGTPAVHWATDKDLIVSVFVGDELAGAVMWCDYPEQKDKSEWVPVASADGEEAAGMKQR